MWSRGGGGGDCIRLTGLPAGADVRVFPGTAVAAVGLPPMAGRLERDGADLCFVPRFAFLDGMSYTVTVEGTSAAVLSRPRPERPATTEVTGIRPTADEVPVNLLRFYVWFSAPMSEGYAGQVRLARDDGSIVTGALLPTEHELWDASRRRLTVLLDPARIKRGLPSHQEVWYPLRSGEPFRLVVGDGFRDAQGLPLRHSAERRYEVGGEERRHVDPVSWELAVALTVNGGVLSAWREYPEGDRLTLFCHLETLVDGRGGGVGGVTCLRGLDCARAASDQRDCSTRHRADGDCLRIETDRQSGTGLRRDHKR